MGLEIERKFLVDRVKWLNVDKGRGIPIQQGYLLSDIEKTIRVRIRDDQGFLTLKGKTQGIRREEFEYEIPVEDAQIMIQNFCSHIISKTRYKIEYAGRLWEVDDFEEDNAGLLMAEIELTSEDEKFELPGWIGKEVSDDMRYYNSNLSKNPYKNWKSL